MADPIPMERRPFPPEESLSQYLYVGKEHPDYQPGNWFVHKYYERSRVPSIDKIAQSERPLRAIELITKAYESKLVQNPETLVFALAVCARQTANQELRHQAYKAIKTICSTTQHFILFVKFASELAKKAPESKHGWGQGLRNAINDWYLSKQPLELAKCVTRYRGRYGWTHKDIMKLSHPKTDDIAKQALLKYVVRGFQEAKNEFGGKPEAEGILNYIESVENFKQCEDEIQAGSLLQMHNFTLDHVSAHFLKSEEVWNSLISSMSLTMLLNNLQRIHNIGLLKPFATAVAKIVDALSSGERIASEKIHPALVLITIRNYEKSGKPLTYEKQKVKDGARKPWLPPMKPNRKIIETLYKTLNASFNNVEATGLRYMITIDMGKSMQENGAWRCGNVMAAEAGCLLALCLVKCEKDVTVATFKNTGVHLVSIDKNGSLGQALGRMKQAQIGSVNMEKPITWALHKKKQIDVFINVVESTEQRDGMNIKPNISRKAIKDYRNSMSLPNSKLVTCTMTATQALSYSTFDKNILTVCGFDANAPKVIEAFARNLF